MREAYYSGLPNGVGAALASAGLGWYFDLGVQYPRMIFPGVFDRHPELQGAPFSEGEKAAIGSGNWDD